MGTDICLYLERKEFGRWVLASPQRQQAVIIAGLTENMQQTRGILHDVIGEMRGGFNNLIAANEVTRKLAEDVGRLAIASQRHHSARIKARK